MIDFMMSPGNMPFTIALIIMLIIGFLEGAMTILGAGMSNFVDNLLPESLEADLATDLEVDFGIEGDGMDAVAPSAMSQFLGWLCVGRVPLLILLVAFLTMFGLLGLLMQQILLTLVGFTLPAWIGWLPALVISLPPTRWLGLGLSKIVPSDETSSVSQDSFVGRIAVVTLGVARKGQPAQGRLKDQHGKTHYVMVEPMEEEDELPAGREVLLIERHGATFAAIKNPIAGEMLG